MIIENYSDIIPRRPTALHLPENFLALGIIFLHAQKIAKVFTAELSGFALASLYDRVSVGVNFLQSCNASVSRRLGKFYSGIEPFRICANGTFGVPWAGVVFSPTVGARINAARDAPDIAVHVLDFWDWARIIFQSGHNLGDAVFW